MRTLQRFLREDDGQDLTEYGLLAALISIAAVLAVRTIGGRGVELYNFILNQLM